MSTHRSDPAPGVLPPAREPVSWRLVVPVKDAERAKTRLEAPLPLGRPELARAVALDTVETACAALGPAAVTVVTSDPVVGAGAAELGARVVPDPVAGLNAAVRAGWEPPGHEALDVAHLRLEGRPGWAAMLGDVPALRPEDLLAALTACARHRRAAVPDADGTGTVLLTSTVAPPEPRFGTGSAARHGEDAEILELDLPRLRRDVDTAEDLRTALALGVGRRTLLALRRAT